MSETGHLGDGRGFGLDVDLRWESKVNLAPTPVSVTTKRSIVMNKRAYRTPKLTRLGLLRTLTRYSF